MTRRNDPHTCWTISAIVSCVHLKNFQVSSLGFELMTFAMSVQCSHQLSYEATQLREGQFVENVLGALMRQSLGLCGKCEDHFFNSSVFSSLVICGKVLSK